MTGLTSRLITAARLRIDGEAITMTRKTKGRAGWHQAIPGTSNCVSYFTFLASHMKAVIVTLALWDWFPMNLAKWINNRGGQHDD
ncbi:MAG: hypothetical protein O7D86_03430 [Proteobacteria bacterium]|nr:hypothetical protein [Pseudomonadota bacterium]